MSALRGKGVAFAIQFYLSKIVKTTKTAPHNVHPIALIPPFHIAIGYQTFINLNENSFVLFVLAEGRKKLVGASNFVEEAHSWKGPSLSWHKHFEWNNNRNYTSTKVVIKFLKLHMSMKNFIKKRLEKTRRFCGRAVAEISATAHARRIEELGAKCGIEIVLRIKTTRLARCRWLDVEQDW